MRHNTVLRSARRFLVQAAFVVASIASTAQAGNVAILAADSAANMNDAQAKIAGSGFFGQVDIINVGTTTPTLAQLQAYTSVLVWSNTNFLSPTALGDVLADYVDAGGGVVVTVFTNSTLNSNRYLQGRWITGTYSVIQQIGGTTSGATQSLGLVLVPSHPVMAGVTTFSGGNSYRPTTTALTAGGTLIAQWTDGKTLVAQHGTFQNRIDLGMFPPSSTVSAANYWDVNTDGARLMANALLVTSAGPVSPSFCLGDGTQAACPCANTGAIGRGCASSAFVGGAVLTRLGNAGASLATDTLILRATDIPGPGLFFQSNSLAGSPIAFGDGQLCAAVGIVRLGVVFPVGGVADYPGGLTPAPIHVSGVVNAGDVKHYQCWYRSVPGLCNPSNFNLTQGLSITWGS